MVTGNWSRRSLSGTETDVEQLKIKFQFARIDDIDNKKEKKNTEIKAKSDQIKRLLRMRIARFNVVLCVHIK